MLRVNTRAGAAGGAERETEARGRCLVTGLEDKIEDGSWGSLSVCQAFKPADGRGLQTRAGTL